MFLKLSVNQYYDVVRDHLVYMEVGGLIVADNLGIERRRGDGVVEVSMTMLMWTLVKVCVSSCDDQESWGGLNRSCTR